MGGGGGGVSCQRFRYVTEGGGHIANVTDRYKRGSEGQIFAKNSVTQRLNDR